ncbi:hypothetical protein ACWAU3_16895 [Shewanella sp. JL219SE-S6]
MMKHLKKVQLFRVGFDEKVSLKEKFFCWPWFAMKTGDKKMATQGAAIQGRTKLIRTKLIRTKSRAKNENPLR